MKEAQTDDSLGTFLFAGLSLAEIMLVSVCQLELSVSLLLQATYSHTLPPAIEITRGRKKESTSKNRAFSDTTYEQCFSPP